MMQTQNFQTFRDTLRLRIRELRLARGYSQEQLGELVSLDRVSVGYIEQGRRTPSLKTLYNLAQAFDIELSELVKRDC